VRKAVGVDVDQCHQLFEIAAQLGVDEVGRVVPEQRGDENAGSVDADRNPDGGADDQARPQAVQKRELPHPNRYPRPRSVLIESRPSFRRSRAT